MTGKMIIVSGLLVLVIPLFAELNADEEIDDEPSHLRMLMSTLQDNHPDLTNVVANTRQSDVRFEEVDLSQSLTNVEGKSYCAFKFTTPEQIGPLVWAFCPTPELVQWFIVPAKGTMHGVMTPNWYVLSRDIPSVGKKGQPCILQQLPVEDLKPSSDYMLWFRYQGRAKPKLTLSLNIFPDMRQPAYRDVFPTLFTNAAVATNLNGPSKFLISMAREDIRITKVQRNTEEGWGFVTVKRPSNRELVFSLEGVSGGKAVDSNTRLTLRQAGANYELCDPAPPNMVFSFGATGDLAEVRATFDGKVFRMQRHDETWGGIEELP